MRITTPLLGLLALVYGVAAYGRGVSPYLPLQLSPEIERDIERVLILADKPMLTRPFAAARVLDALPAACKRDQKLCGRVRDFLDRYMNKSGVEYASAEISASQRDIAAIPNRHGLAADSPFNVSAAGYLQVNDYFFVNGGLVADRDSLTATGSFVSLGYEYAQLDVGFRDHWFSPMTDSSMLISTQAATMPSITLSNYTPISSLGFQYEIFGAEMSLSHNIRYQDRTTTGNPLLAGIHLSIAPAAGWSLGVNRLFQYGGGERDNTGFTNFLKALFKPHEYDNTSDTSSSDQQFGNQVAAWTSRMVFPGRVPFAVYFEYAGEDSSYSGNYRIGNVALSAGIDIPRLWGAFDFTYEVSEWQNGWYVHSIYLDGLVNDGRVIGHWFGDERQANDAVGGQSHMVRVGWEPGFGGVAEFRYRTLANATYSGVDYSRAQDLTLRYSYPWRDMLIGGEINVGRDVFAEHYSSVAAFMRFGGNHANRSMPEDTSDTDSASDTDSTSDVDYFIDAGSSISKVRVNLADGNAADTYITNTRFAPHIGLGARRAISENGALGARIEFDQIEDHLLIAVRALDYRHNYGRHFAMTAFAGAARYDLATPAFGYYGGIGAQWRNLTRKLDLNLDVRYGDKMARDKLLPSDPASTPRPDVFYDLMGATLYFSYRL